MCERVKKYRAKKRKLLELNNLQVNNLHNFIKDTSREEVNCQNLEVTIQQETRINEIYVSNKEFYYYTYFIYFTLC